MVTSASRVGSIQTLKGGEGKKSTKHPKETERRNEQRYLGLCCPSV